ncbi:hypothetical protein E1091_01245 [Micromonospora fluostatini]|uniref:SLATT domain-containing protein n=1 Tax=Micromonospora fluostatini TaxID=1629071 RepID=A0ABY2DMG6_9ACTN|nr:hypothetical protein E1091_01245 [Micromonospora fluostatini]
MGDDGTYNRGDSDGWRYGVDWLTTAPTGDKELTALAQAAGERRLCFRRWRRWANRTCVALGALVAVYAVSTGALMLAGEIRSGMMADAIFIGFLAMMIAFATAIVARILIGLLRTISNGLDWELLIMERSAKERAAHVDEALQRVTAALVSHSAVLETTVRRRWADGDREAGTALEEARQALGDVVDIASASGSGGWTRPRRQR